MAFEKDPDEIGALWLKSGKKGDYMTGTINGQPVVCFGVTAKSDKAPTWRVLKSKPREQMPNDQRTSIGRVITDQDVPF